VAVEFARASFLALLPLALLPLVWPRRRRAVRYSSLGLVPPDRTSRWLEWGEKVLGAVFVIAMTMSLSGPQTPARTATSWRTGARVVFVLDQSASMFSPWRGPQGGRTKLTVAKEAIRTFVAGRHDEVALIGFGRSSIVYLQPTFDHERLLRSLELQEQNLGDTVIDAALERALDLLEARVDPIPSQAVVFLSDGAGRLRDPEGIAERFRTGGVRLYWVEIEGGDPPDPAVEALLHKLEPLGQRFVVGTSNELPKAFHAIGELERSPIRFTLRTARHEWERPARWVAAACLGLLAFFAAGERGRLVP